MLIYACIYTYIYNGLSAEVGGRGNVIREVKEGLKGMLMQLILSDHKFESLKDGEYSDLFSDFTEKTLYIYYYYI